MGMGYAGAYADVIDPKSIERFCRKEFNAFMKVVAESTVDFEEFARNVEVADLADYDEELVNAYQSLYEAFLKKTGLSLGLAFHDSQDQGDGYDEIDGAYWYVDGMYQLSPAGKKMKKFVERKMFVQFG